MSSGAPDIIGFFKTLDDCIDCNFNEQFAKYADYLSIAKIEDTVYINNKPISKNVDYVSENVGTEYFEVTLGSEDSVITVIRFTYKQFPPQPTPDQKNLITLFKNSVAGLAFKHSVCISL